MIIASTEANSRYIFLYKMLVFVATMGKSPTYRVYFGLPPPLPGIGFGGGEGVLVDISRAGLDVFFENVRCLEQDKIEVPEETLRDIQDEESKLLERPES